MNNKSMNAANLNEQELIQHCSKEQLARLFLEERKASAKLKKKNRELIQKTNNISSEIEAQQQFIANKLMKRLNQVQEEKQMLNKRLMQQEENITNNLRKRLKELIDQKVEMENQLQQEQQYMTNKLSQQFILQKKLETQKRIKEDLIRKIQHEERIVKKALLSKLEQLQKDKIVMQNQFQAEGEYMLNTIRTTLDRIMSQKNNLQHQLSNQVKQKQDIVLALEKEKTHLTKALQKKIKQIKRDKKLIKSHIKSQTPYPEYGSNSSTPRAHLKELPNYYSSSISMTNHSSNNKSYSRKQSQSQSTSHNLYNMMTPNGATQMSENQASESEKSARNSSLGKKYNGSELLDPSISTPGSSKPASARKLHQQDEFFQNSSRSFNQQFEASGGPATPKEYEERRLSIGGNSCTSAHQQTQCGEQLEKFFQDSEQRLQVLQRDKEYYQRRHSAMMRKILGLTVQLNTQRQEARKYSHVIDQIQQNTLEGSKLAKMLYKDQAALKQKFSRCDISIDSYTDSSIISMDSSFSMQSDEKMSLRGSVQSIQDNQLMQAIRQNNSSLKPI